MAIDDHARLAFTAMHPDEKKEQTVGFLRNAVDYYERLGVSIKRCSPSDLIHASHLPRRSRPAPVGVTRGFADLP